MAKEDKNEAVNLGMLMDGIACSETWDSSGEILRISGCDISSLDVDGVVNWEHMSPEDQGHSALDIVGKILYAHKILTVDDCENERQKMYWDTLGGLPYVYIVYRLADMAGHPGAQAMAALVRDSVAHGEAINIKLSIEGTTLTTSKDKKELLTSVCRRVAATIKPANKSCDVGLLSDPGAPSGYSKAPSVVKGDWLQEVLKRSEHEHPDFTPLGGSTAVSCNPILPEEFLPVKKTITAGNYNAAPGTLTGGAALQVEDPSLKVRRWAQQARKAMSNWDSSSDIKTYLKHELPEASDEFITRFSDLVNDLKVGKKGSVLKSEAQAEPLLSKHETLIRKFENWTVSLNKAAADFKAEKEQTKAVVKPPMQIQFKGQQVRPGKATFQGKQVALLHGDEKHLYGVPMEKLHSFRAEDLLKLPRKAEQIGFTVDKYPAPVNVKPVVDAAIHGTQFNTKPKQNALIHGLDLSKVGTAPKKAAFGVNENHMNWHTGPKGKVAVKSDAAEGQFMQADREALFHNLAHDFFGLGEHVPTVAHFAHPHTGISHVAIEQVKGEHPATTMTGELKDPQQKQALLEAGNSGKLDKMAMMDAVLGMGDRHSYNWMMDRSNKPMLIDHGSAFESQPSPSDYWEKYHTARDGVGNSNWTYEPLHPSAREWIGKLDPAKLEDQMQKHGTPQQVVDQTVSRLTNLKAALAAKPELTKFEAQEIGSGWTSDFLQNAVPSNELAAAKAKGQI